MEGQSLAGLANSCAHPFLRRLYRRLWCGNVAAAMAFLEAYRLQAKNEPMLETLSAYLHAREAWIPNYRFATVQKI